MHRTTSRCHPVSMLDYTAMPWRLFTQSGGVDSKLPGTASKKEKKTFPKTVDSRTTGSDPCHHEAHATRALPQ